ncbi:VOC family protein [Rufibacter immobilis]|uniref:VOC family protein n=1 Tax=Rufibacter immobilis TaxID=1348778 RepID=UPI001C83996B|nr:VOC family protein [Rufibacter immobilis]
MILYKPRNYNSLSPYLIVDDAQVLVDSLTAIFDVTTQKCFKHENGKIAHLELKIDDTIVMISDSTEAYEAIKSLLHVYVPDVFKTFEKPLKMVTRLLKGPSTNPVTQI